VKNPHTVICNGGRLSAKRSKRLEQPYCADIRCGGSIARALSVGVEECVYIWPAGQLWVSAPEVPLGTGALPGL